MIRKYRKKPVEIEAVQFDDTIETWKLLTEWSDGAVCDYVEPNETPTGRAICYIETLEGKMKCDEGSYVIKGVNGEFYACTEDVFDKTYEEV